MEQKEELSQEEVKRFIAKESRKHYREINEQKKRFSQKCKELKEKSGIVEQKITFKDYENLFLMVLETGETGTKAIKRCAEEKNKDEKWKRIVAKRKIKKIFKILLEKYANNPAIIRLIKNQVYNKKSILNFSLTGALTELSKQIKLSDNIENKNMEKEELKKMLEIKDKFKDSESKELIKQAQIMRNRGKSTREIGQIFGKSPSWVSKYTTKPQKTDFDIEL